MIQRIQTLYLVISIGLLSAISFGMSFWNIEKNSDIQGVLNVFGYKWTDSSFDLFPIVGATSLIIVLQLWAIFSFKKLKFQYKLANFSLILSLITVLVVSLLPILGQNVDMGTNYKFSLGIGSYLLFASLPLSFLAARAIKKDKNLIDSLNRLR